MEGEVRRGLGDRCGPASAGARAVVVVVVRLGRGADVVVVASLGEAKVRSGGADASAFSDLRAEVETARGREAAKKAACERLEAATPWSIRLIWGVYAFNRFAQGFRP